MKSELINTETTKQTPEIDWSIPNQLVRFDDGEDISIIITTGENTVSCFSGFRIYTTLNSGCKFSKNWDKSSYHLIPSNEVITISFQNQ